MKSEKLMMISNKLLLTDNNYQSTQSLPNKKMKIYGKRLVRLVIIVSQSTKGANPYKPR